MPSPIRVRCRPGSSMKFSPTVAEMADISPMCSIMEAMAMGAMTKMAEISNFATLPPKFVTKGWKPRMGFVPLRRRGVRQAGEVHHAGHQGNYIGPHHAQQDGDNLDHALAPDIGHNDDGHGHQGQPPAGGGVGHGGGGQVQSDQDDDGAGDHGGQVVHDPVDAHGLDDQGQDHIQKARHHDAAAGVLELFRGLHGGVDAGVHLRHGLEAAQEGKGGAQEGGDLQPGAHMEKEGAEAGENRVVWMDRGRP